MKLPHDQIETIMGLGYTEIEARFLYIVATHAGYFTLRQFLLFAGVHWGKRSTSFAQKLLGHGHASIRNYMGTGCVFHLFSRLVYGRIEKDNLSNRRRHSFEYIRTRLVLLDFLLENLDCDFLESEPDKVRFFCETLAVPKDALPAKVYEGGPNGRPTVRYFVDKFPFGTLRSAANGNGTSTSCQLPTTWNSFLTPDAVSTDNVLKNSTTRGKPVGLMNRHCALNLRNSLREGKSRLRLISFETDGHPSTKDRKGT